MLWSDEDFDSFLAAVKKFAEEGASPLVGQNDVPTWKDCFGSERTSNVFHSADFAIEKSLEFVNNVKEKSDLNKQRQQHELQMKTRLEEDLKEKQKKQQKKQQTLEEAIKIRKKIETQIAAPKTDVKVNTEVSAAKWFNVDSFSMADHKDKIVVVDFWARRF